MAEKTVYSSIDTYLKGRFRPLSGPDDPALSPVGAVAGGSIREEFMAASHLPEPVNRFLCQMDIKLDSILAGMRSASLEQDFPHILTVSRISASELAFAADVPVAPGDWLEVVLNLGQGGLFAASGVGEVKAMARTSSGSVFTFVFFRLPEEEREKIIRFVFSEERKNLREKRLE